MNQSIGLEILSQLFLAGEMLHESSGDDYDRHFTRRGVCGKNSAKLSRIHLARRLTRYRTGD
jgi:hypothetical protein